MGTGNARNLDVKNEKIPFGKTHERLIHGFRERETFNKLVMILS